LFEASLLYNFGLESGSGALNESNHFFRGFVRVSWVDKKTRHQERVNQFMSALFGYVCSTFLSRPAPMIQSLSSAYSKLSLGLKRQLDTSYWLSPTNAK
jgi:hypothetical protein